MVGPAIEKLSLDQWLATIENHWKPIEYNCTETKTIDHSIVVKNWLSLNSNGSHRSNCVAQPKIS